MPHSHPPNSIQPPLALGALDRVDAVPRPPLQSVLLVLASWVTHPKHLDFSSNVGQSISACEGVWVLVGTLSEFVCTLYSEIYQLQPSLKAFLSLLLFS